MDLLELVILTLMTGQIVAQVKAAEAQDQVAEVEAEAVVDLMMISPQQQYHFLLMILLTDLQK